MRTNTSLGKNLEGTYNHLYLFHNIDLIFFLSYFFRGGFSIVKEGRNRITGEKVAVKFIEKKFVDQEELKLLQREIDIMARVSSIFFFSSRKLFNF